MNSFPICSAISTAHDSQRPRLDRSHFSFPISQSDHDSIDLISVFSFPIWSAISTDRDSIDLISRLGRSHFQKSVCSQYN